MKRIIEITWNWSPACMESNGERIDCYSDTELSAKESDEDVINIEEVSTGIHNKFFYDINYTDGITKRIFNPNTVSFVVSDK